MNAEIIDFLEYKRKKEAGELVPKKKKEESVLDKMGLFLVFIYSEKDPEKNDVLIHFSHDVENDKDLSSETVPFLLFRFMLFCCGFDDVEILGIILDSVNNMIFNVDLDKNENKEKIDLDVERLDDRIIIKKLCKQFNWDYDLLSHLLFDE